MYYVYFLKSTKVKTLYLGCTNDLERRVAEHNSGSTFSTKRYLPWKVVYVEGYADEGDARDREKKLKQFGKVYAHLKRRIRRSLQS